MDIDNIKNALVNIDIDVEYNLKNIQSKLYSLLVCLMNQVLLL